MRIVNVNFDVCADIASQYLMTGDYIVRKPIYSYWIFWWAIDLLLIKIPNPEKETP